MNGKTKTVRNDYIDFLRGILIFLVVFGHTIQFIHYKNILVFLDDPVYKLIYIFHMPLFMAISGFVSYGSINKKTVTKSVSDRFRQLIIPIICWTFMINLILLIVYVISNNTTMEQTFLSFVKSGFNQTLGRRFWFLWSLFFSSLIVSLLRVAKIDNLAVFLLTGILLLLIPDIRFSYLFKYTFPYFCLGYCVAKSNKFVFPLTPGYFAVFICLLISLVCFMTWEKSTYIYVSKMNLSSYNVFHIIFMYVGGIMLSITFIVMTSIIYNTTKSQIISELGKSSLSIYIMQTFLFIYILRIMPPYEYPAVLSFVIVPLFAMIITFVIYFVAKWICRYSLPGMLLFGRVARR